MSKQIVEPKGEKTIIIENNLLLKTKKTSSANIKTYCYTYT